MRWASSAMSTWSAPASASEWTAMGRRPRRFAVRIARQADLAAVHVAGHHDAALRRVEKKPRVVLRDEARDVVARLGEEGQVRPPIDFIVKPNEDEPVGITNDRNDRVVD